MKLLVHNANILAQDPVEDTDRITANGAVFYKATMPGWEIIDTALPDNFSIDSYQYSQGDLQQITKPEDVPREIDAVAAIIVIEQYGLGVAYRNWVASLPWDKQEIVSRRGKWRRDNTILNAGAAAMGISNEQLDEMFIVASKIQL